MNNQSSPAQLLFPTVPASYCPEGKWSDILNSFIQLYLNNGTVNIPFLNEVTPQQITELQQSLLTIQNTLDSVTPQTGTITSLATAGSMGTYVVTFPTPMPNADYTINITFVSTATPTTADMSWSLLSGSKTTTGFTFYSLRSSTDNVSQIIWTVANIAAL